MTETTDIVIPISTLPAWINLSAIVTTEELEQLAASAIEVEQWLDAGRDLLARAGAAYKAFTEAIPESNGDADVYELIAHRVPQFVALDVALMKAGNATLNAIGEKDHFVIDVEAGAR